MTATGPFPEEDTSGDDLEGEVRSPDPVRMSVTCPRMPKYRLCEKLALCKIQKLFF